MLVRILTALALIVSVTVVAPAAARGGAVPAIQDQNAQRIKEKIQKKGTGEKAKVTAKLNNQTTYKGYIREANENDFVIVDRTGGTHTVRYADVRSLGGGGLSGGAKLALGIAVGAAIVVAIIAGIAVSDD